ncbi:TPA: hypothetical protein ACXKGV_005303 [Klebsiella oxytoca]|uniref:hypothetical protein n=1 Tax=Klebsiella michiganensis TaxID=1134687 RepID=UPI0027F81D51|nr:hypothetical protein [Klebsiella michiganensis]HDP1328245.1 hypothetical protein [Klebsiella pneumoniae]HDT6006561.1 hypothetical protein [Klebsiella michiganensis]
MITELIAEHVGMATAAQAWLQARGSRVTEMRVWMRRPCLEITCPPNELVNRANHLIERCPTGTRSVWMATIEGCHVIWR